MLVACAVLMAACSDDGASVRPESGVPPLVDGGVPLHDGPMVDAGTPVAVDAPPLMEDAPMTTPDDGAVAAAKFCELGQDVPGATVPGGFCLRRFASVTEARTMVFAPNGDLFVAAPSTGTPGGSNGGPGAILVLSDDNHDGVAEITTFAKGLADVHGLTMGDGFLYFTTMNDVWRTPYVVGQRMETGPREQFGLPVVFSTGGRWTHGLAHSAGGVLYASRGQYGSCGGNSGGDIARVSVGNMSVVANGFRNPMYMRCHYKDELCAATELGEDGQPGAREKLLGLRPMSDYGYPCCYSTDKPTAAASPGACTGVKLEDASFVLSDTPFGFDWEHDMWPAPYKGAVFVALHGSFYTSPQWAGARIVFANVDPTTHMPTETWRDFVGGFGPGGSVLERPSDVTFAPDGRMFFADDQGGGVYWIAPASLARPN